MKQRFVVLFLLGACTAWSIGLGVGGFGGIAIPTGAMGDEDDPGNEDWDASNLGNSPAFGGKFLVEVMPLLELEAAVAYHTGHPYKDWEDTPGIEEPFVTLVPITFGANVKYLTGPLGVYGGAGLGYYLENTEITGVVETPFGDIPFKAEADANGLGLYLSGGVLFNFGDFAVDVNPRYHYIMNEGTIDYTMEAEFEGFHWSETESVDKDFNDTYVDIRAGVDYFFM